MIEAATDPEISLFPDHVLMKNIDALAAAVSKGDNAPVKNAGHILRQAIESKMEEIKR